MRPDVETAGTLAVPIWLAAAGAAVLAVSLSLAITRAAGVAVISSLFRVGLIAVGVLAVWLYLEQRWGSATGSNPGSGRRSLDDRKAALMAGAIAPSSALSCLDEIAGEAVEGACEKAVFASPEAVAAGVKYVTAQLELLNDGTAYAERGDVSYAASPHCAPRSSSTDSASWPMCSVIKAVRRNAATRSCGSVIPQRCSPIFTITPSRNR
jgi:hypothetical protein